jgi:hypothetical protein
VIAKMGWGVQGLLTEGFFWIPSLAGPTTISARQNGSGVSWLFPFVVSNPELTRDSLIRWSKLWISFRASHQHMRLMTFSLLVSHICCLHCGSVLVGAYCIKGCLGAC